MITFENWELRAQGGLAHQYDNLSRRLEVLGNLPEGWEWTMLVQVDDHMDLIPLAPMEGGVGTDLTREQLALAGVYQLQLRGQQGERVRHTNTEYVQVFHSLSGDSNWPQIPSEFTQIEERIQEMGSHPPVPGEQGFWLVWSPEEDRYVESEYPLPAGGSSGSVGADGGYYIPALAEDGTLSFTPSKEDMPQVTAANVRGPKGEKGEKGDTGPAGPAGADGANGKDGADGRDGAGLDVTGAAAGQIVRIAAVDEAGVPTAWEPVDLPENSSNESSKKSWVLLDSVNTTEEINNFTVNIDPALGYRSFFAQVEIIGSASNSNSDAMRLGFNNSAEGSSYLVYLSGIVLANSGKRYCIVFRDLDSTPIPGNFALSGTGSPVTPASAGFNSFDATPKEINRFYMQVDGGKVLGIGTKIRVFGR